LEDLFMPRQWTGRLAEYDEDDDERQVVCVDDNRHRNVVLDTPLQRGFLRAGLAALAMLGVAALIAVA